MRIDWFDLAVQGIHVSSPTILLCSAFFMVQFSHPYMTTGNTIALTRQTFLGKVISLLFNMLSRFVMEKGLAQPTPVFLPREFHGQRSLVGYSPWGHKESDMTLPVCTKL